MTMPTNAQNTKPVRIGFIGAGGICRQRHLPGLNALDNIELVAVCNRSQASGQKIADEFGFSEVMTDWKQLLDRDDIDAVLSAVIPTLMQKFHARHWIPENMYSARQEWLQLSLMRKGCFNPQKIILNWSTCSALRLTACLGKLTC